MMWLQGSKARQYDEGRQCEEAVLTEGQQLVFPEEAADVACVEEGKSTVWFDIAHCPGQG